MNRVLSIVIGCLMLLATACQSDQEVAANFQKSDPGPDQEGWNATLTTTTDGVTSSKIKYSHMESYESKRIITFKNGVEIDFYDTLGVHVSKVFADQAVLHEDNNNIELTGRVRVRAHDGTKLFTEKLLLDEDSGKVMSDAFAIIVTAENDTINGEGFESEKSLKNWLIRKPWGVTQKKLNLLEKRGSRKQDSEAKNIED